MPWQQLVADVANEMLEDGSPAFREVIVSVPRQQGKTTWLLSQTLERCTLRDTPQKVAYTAQTGADARKKLLNDQVPILQGSPLWAAVRRVSRAQGNEGVIFRNGSRVDVLASSVSAGHGKIIDLAEIDEAFDDIDDRREQAMLPAMVTRPEAQLIVVSTMGTDASVYLNRKVDAGRAAALEGRTSGIAYFEWSIPESADLDDPRSWYLGMPALGLSIQEPAIAHAKATMSPGEFRRAFGNQRTRSSERVIPEVSWRLVQSSTAAPEDALVFAVEVSPDRDWAAIVSGGKAADGKPCVEMLEYKPGTGWVVPRLVELVGRHGGRVVLETRAPAGALLPDLQASRLQVSELSPSDATQACGAFFDAVADTKLWVRTDPRFDAAVLAAGKQPVADAWRFGRKAGGDVCPLNAAVWAHWACRGEPPKLARLVSL